MPIFMNIASVDLKLSNVPDFHTGNRQGHNFMVKKQKSIVLFFCIKVDDALKSYQVS